MTKTTPEQNKALVLKAFDTLFNKRDYEAAARFWSDELHPAQRSYRTRPRRPVRPDPQRTRQSALRTPAILAEGDYVIVHGRFTGTAVPLHG